jgi:hypothetical protein
VVPQSPPQPELKLRDHPDPDDVPEDYSDVVNPETDVFEPETYQDMEPREALVHAAHPHKTPPRTGEGNHGTIWKYKMF